MLFDVLLLYLLGVLGWRLVKALKIPVPALLGPLLFLGTFRALDIDLPRTPAFFTPLLQILLGVSIGARFSKDVVARLKKMILPGLIIVVWALTLVFLLGWFLAQITYLDPFTAMLASSMGGLPEMTIIALAVDADIGVIFIVQLFRLLITFSLFPAILKKQPGVQGNPEGDPVLTLERPAAQGGVFQICAVLLFGALGGALFLSLGVPAGGLVGSMIFVTAASCLGFPVFTYPPLLFEILMMGVGIIGADNISSATLSIITSGEILLPVCFSLLFTFSTSFLVAHMVKGLTGWDTATSFLAAAPAGLTTMTLLAMKNNLDPLPITMLHLCRVLALKTIVPLVFMFYV